ncbi:EAL domain-containing protein [Rivibacter subsaxonicus]|uniref:EAL domain-containing protein (Putative c-di-GMP-specific phosphodiesterase class I) n=1 Tax=Rivibacter subsaxonicus TaxID=457575 RepID=A0A4Q7W0Z0_9BURK|nr:EAL domain-containing protein [Rivibacter subsaxonicus]RZU02904.1 EAL domain-containing protein (putative c-di-GMP-specific phosphodiesterase class I) [Rivibacter subsaxonicus]
MSLERLLDVSPASSFAAIRDRLLDQAGAVVAEDAGLLLRSHFQPIFSLSHGRVVGHEALLRATDASGRAVAPPQYFGCESFETLLWRDRLARSVHAANYLRMAQPHQRLFLNLHPQVFLRAAQLEADGFQEQWFEHFGLRGEQLVIEVLEDALGDAHDFDAAVEYTRRRGCLIALDDFGAGHSNFDRVWRLRPEIVKLDRSLVARAARERQAFRIVSQMVSLLHECGALVLMEGVETEVEAYVAIDTDVDLVQGRHFADSGSRLAADAEATAVISRAWAAFERRWRDDRDWRVTRIRPYRDGLLAGAALLGAGQPLAVAAAQLLALPQTQICYLLDESGRQMGLGVRAPEAPEYSRSMVPVEANDGARWSRRAYYRRAIDAVGKVQVTRPYRTVDGLHQCVTGSIAFPVQVDGQQQLRVLCVDVAYDG